MLFLISSGIPLICPLMLKWLSIVKGVSYRSSMITQTVSVLHRAAVGEKDCILCLGGRLHKILVVILILWQAVKCSSNSLTPSATEVAVAKTAWTSAHFSAHWQLQCYPHKQWVLPSLLFGLQGQRWLSEIKLWNHIFRQDQMLSVSAFNMTARFVMQLSYFQRCSC